MSRTVDTVTFDEMYACAVRELRMRESNYPKWVRAGRMEQDKAEKQILFQQAIVAHLATKLAQGDMFS